MPTDDGDIELDVQTLCVHSDSPGAVAVIVACGGSELSRPSSQISTSVDDDAAVGDVVDASAELDSAAVDDADVATPDASAIPVHDGGPACSAAAPYCAPGFCDEDGVWGDAGEGGIGTAGSAKSGRSSCRLSSAAAGCDVGDFCIGFGFALYAT